MKKLIIGLALFCAASSAFCQDEETLPAQSQPLTKHDYLVKSRSQKIAGFIFLGVGVGLWAIAAPGNVSFSTLSTLVIGGGACVVISIPLFIASGKNKRRAMKMSAYIQINRSPLYMQTGFKGVVLPALALRVHF